MPPGEKMKYLRDKKTPRCQRTSYEGGYWPIQCLRAAKAPDAKGTPACGQHLAADKARVTRAIQQEHRADTEMRAAEEQYQHLREWLRYILLANSPHTKIIRGPEIGLGGLYVQIAAGGTLCEIILRQMQAGAPHVAQEAPTGAPEES